MTSPLLQLQVLSLMGFLGQKIAHLWLHFFLLGKECETILGLGKRQQG